MVHTDWGAVTDAGGRRRVNEDAVLAAPPVFLVADGMGGHVYGALAAQCVVEAFEAFAAGLEPGAPVEPAQILAVIDHSRDLIRAGVRAAQGDRPESRARPTGETGGHDDPGSGEPPLAGSTAAGLVLTTQQGVPYWLAFNVGDSRIYRYDEDGLVQVSVDHSVVQELLDAGAITAGQAREHPQRNVITRAVDSSHDVDVDFWMLHAGGPQRLLLCSDGLTEELTPDEVTASLAAPGDAEQACRDLVERATRAGARDNVSAVVVDLLADGAAQSTAPRCGGRRASSADAGAELDDTLPRAGAIR
ncbi:PP2C family protein-serine/threonine phosphatase [Pseudactinotalea sp. Z1732]|uniref:PP2C family protein-serine/threonine phosphatase n=1 Tax=Micrococcales TaxID=85006 RepID=UPI003C7E24DB